MATPALEPTLLILQEMGTLPGDKVDGMWR